MEELMEEGEVVGAIKLINSGIRRLRLSLKLQLISMLQHAPDYCTRSKDIHKCLSQRKACSETTNLPNSNKNHLVIQAHPKPAKF